MAGPITATKLTCNGCGVSTAFHKKIYLNFRPSGGTTEEFAGYVCRQCGADVDTGKMIQRQELERKKEELRQLQQEVGQVPHDTMRVQDTAKVSLKEG